MVRLQLLLLVHLWQWLRHWLMLSTCGVGVVNCTVRAINQENFDEYFSCKEQIGVVGCPGVVDSPKPIVFPLLNLSTLSYTGA